MNKQEALQWFVDFANMNLDELKPGDRAKLQVESEEYLSPKEDLVQPGLGHAWAIETPEEKEVLEWATAWIIQAPKKNTAEYWATLKALQEFVIETLREFLIPGDGFGFSWQGKMMIRAIWQKTLTLSYTPLARSHREYIQLKIYQLLNGYPRGAIQKCSRCEKYFFNPTFRQKEFCSPRCASRAHAAKRRGADPEGYNEYQRELMEDKRRKDRGLRTKRFYKT